MLKFPCTVTCTGTDPEYLQEVARIKEERDKRLFLAESFRAYETQCVKEEFEREKSLADTEFEVDILKIPALVPRLPLK